MGVTGFLILILVLFLRARSAVSAPSQKICDNRVLDKYIGDIMEVEKAMDSCNALCEFPEEVIVPETKLNQAEWRKLQTTEKAAVVWTGLNLFTEALPKLSKLLSETKLTQQVEKFISVSRNVINVLKSHNLQVEMHIPDPEERTRSVSTLKQFFSVYTNFLRGKYKLLLNIVCKL